MGFACEVFFLMVTRHFQPVQAPTRSESPPMSALPVMSESELHQRADALLLKLQEQLDEVDAEIDSELASGILTLTFETASKIIINRQTPNRELWVAAKSGGFHFRYVSPTWVDTRSGQSLEQLLSRVISEQAGSRIEITLDQT